MNSLRSCCEIVVKALRADLEHSKGAIFGFGNVTNAQNVVVDGIQTLDKSAVRRYLEVRGQSTAVQQGRGE